MSEPVAYKAPPERRSLLAIVAGVVTSRDFVLRLMIGAVGAAVLGLLGPMAAFVGLVLSQLLGDTIKELVTSRNWSVRRLWFVTVLALLFDRLRRRVAAGGAPSVAAPLASTLAATVVVVGAFTAADAARGQSVLGNRHTTFFGGASRATAPSLRLPDGSVATSSARLTFRSVPVGGSSQPESLVLSSGSRELRRLRVAASPAAFLVESGCPRRLPAHSSCSVGLVFQPDQAGRVEGRLTISFVEDPELTLVLEGTAVQAGGATLEPSSVSFGRTTIGSTSPAATVTLRAGGVLLPIAGIDTGSKEFRVAANDCPARLPAGRACRIRIVFAPVSAGLRAATLTVVSRAGGRPLTAGLTGTAVSEPVQAQLTPARADFGSVGVGTRSAPGSFTLAAGSSALPIAGLDVTTGDYRVTTDDCPAQLDAGHSCTIGVTFVPVAAGDRPGRLVVSRSDGRPQLSAALDGVGVTVGPTLAPADRDFGSIDVGTSSAPTGFTLGAGSAPFPYGAATTASKDFRITANTCGGTLDPSSTCTISVVFAPVFGGDRSATLTVSRTDGGPALTAALTGIGLQPYAVLSPTSVEFGHALSPQVQNVTLSNTGNATLTIRGIASSDTKHFTVDDGSCGKTLAPSGSCTFSITFTPSFGPSQATITLDADGRGQHSLAVSGLGIPPPS